MLTGSVRLAASGDGTSLDLLDRLVLHHSLKVGIDADKVIQAVLRLIFVSTSCVAIDVVCYIIARGREHAEELAHGLVLVLDIISNIAVIVSKRRHVPHHIRLD